jgi:hypothetical protein
MLRSARRQRLRAAVLGIGGLVVVVVVLAGLLRERVSTDDHADHQHALVEENTPGADPQIPGTASPVARLHGTMGSLHPIPRGQET